MTRGRLSRAAAKGIEEFIEDMNQKYGEGWIDKDWNTIEREFEERRRI